MIDRREKPVVLATMLSFFTFAPMSVNAQDSIDFSESVFERWHSYSQRIDGEKHAELLPHSVKLHALFRAGLPALSERLSFEDSRIVAIAAQAEESARAARESEDYASVVCPLAEQRNPDQIDSVRIAKLIAAADERFESAARTRYTELIEKLSVEGQLAVSSVITSAMRHLIHVETDYVGQAIEFPELAALRYKAACEFRGQRMASKTMPGR
jgi:hypothetical protein